MWWISVFYSLCSLCSFYVVCAKDYDPHQSLVNVWLSGAAYCDKKDYPKMVVAGPAYGFVYKYTIYDTKTDLQGVVGVIHREKRIYVAYRGTSSYSNWMSDLEVKQIPYATYPECNCKIHTGFYQSALNVKSQTVDALMALTKKYPNYSVVITGHSYGAAVAQIMAMELLTLDYEVDVYNYGQPRVGNQKYADFVNVKLNSYWRFTHNRDIVPHLPPTEGFDYYHSCGEVFENEKHQLKMCSETVCEDPQCADNYPLKDTTVNDHYYYLNHRVQCNESTVEPFTLFQMLFIPMVGF